MFARPINILVIEDNPGDTHLLREALAGVREASFLLECAGRLGTGLDRRRSPSVRSATHES